MIVEMQATEVSRNSSGESAPSFNDRIPTFAAYVRKSVDDNRENAALKDQADAINNWADANGYNIEHVFSDIASGASTDRAGLTSAVKFVIEKNVDGLVVFKLDRLGRDTLQILSTLKQFELASRCFVSATESNIRFGPLFASYSDLQSRTSLLVHCLIAETERINTKIRTKNTSDQRALKELGQSEHAPYGTRFVFVLEDGSQAVSAKASDLKRYRNANSKDGLSLIKHEGEYAQMEILFSYSLLYYARVGTCTSASQMMRVLRDLKMDHDHRKENGFLRSSSNLKKVFKRWLLFNVKKGSITETWASQHVEKINAEWDLERFIY